MDNPREFETLVKIIARLRGPGGCPWDKAQTHSSLRTYLLEETYEVLEALDEKDSKKLCAELGDLLLQIVLHAQVASECGEFDIGDVVEGISKKLLYRHPHVFGKGTARTPGEVEANWEELKRAERDEGTSILAHLPKELPSLTYSQQVQARVARVGFDWPDIDGVIEKLGEEINELKEALNSEEKEQEFGDLLFTLANIARRMDIDLESALRQANAKFFRRFSYMEGLCRERGLDFQELTFQQQNALWEEAKRATGPDG